MLKVQIIAEGNSYTSQGVLILFRNIFELDDKNIYVNLNTTVTYKSGFESIDISYKTFRYNIYLNICEYLYTIF